MFFTTARSLIDFHTNNLLTVSKRLLLKAELDSTGIFMVAMITQILILHGDRHHGKNIKHIALVPSGKELAEHIWQVKKQY